MTCDQTHQQPGRGAAIAHVECASRLHQAADADAVNNPCPIIGALYCGPHRAHGGGCGQDIFAFGKRQVNARAYCAGFNFKGADQQKKVGLLSGGERNRVHLAKLLKSGGNLLLLDEPTNDLDVDTLRALEDALLGFAGCAVVISHDRWFLDRIATHILAFEGDSEAFWFEGNYQDYAADYKRRKGVAVDQPHRIRYKKLVH